MILVSFWKFLLSSTAGGVSFVSSGVLLSSTVSCDDFRFVSRFTGNFCFDFSSNFCFLTLIYCYICTISESARFSL